MEQETEYIVVYHLFDITQEGEIQERIGYGDKKNWQTMSEETKSKIQRMIFIQLPQEDINNMVMIQHNDEELIISLL